MNNSTEAADNQTDLELKEFRRSTYAVAIPLLWTFCLLSTLCNLVVLVSLRWLRSTMSPTLCFSISLAVADLLTSILVGVGLAVNSYLPMLHGIELLSTCYLLTIEAFRLGCIIVSVLHLLALAVNHYVGIVRPLHYASTVTKRTAYFTLGIIWTCPFAFFLLYFASITGEGFRSQGCNNLEFMKQLTFRVILSVLFFSPLVAMNAMYGRIFAIVRQHQRGLPQYPMSTRQMQKNVKAVVTTLLILGTYLVGLMPAVFLFVLICFDCPIHPESINGRVYIIANIIANTFIVLKALSNPAIYAARMPEVRGALHMTRCWLTGAPCVYPDSLLSRTETMTSSLRMYSMKNGRRFVANSNPGIRAGTPSSCCSATSVIHPVTQADRSLREDLLTNSFVPEFSKGERKHY